MGLLDRADVYAGDLVLGVEIQDMELDIRCHCPQWHRKEGSVLLSDEGLFELVVVTVDVDLVARDIGRGEEREALDVIPVEVGHEEMDAQPLPGASFHQMLPEVTNPRARVEDDEVGGAGADLDARRVASVARAYVERELALDEVVDVVLAV